MVWVRWGLRWAAAAWLVGVVGGTIWSSVPAFPRNPDVPLWQQVLGIAFLYFLESIPFLVPVGVVAVGLHYAVERLVQSDRLRLCVLT